ncbi:ParB/RepB/Spo0J family partition protein [Polaromonas naphthalenivorans]|uniref:ParB-like partition proteins n=1 Tax=Polaromonas naphthalenivorans (strain CJ2) TaxID=365044 RepID=A1VWT5_POLNA|nr:ParB/RepB/Spo0J family partition protein [Polaromonas naphthalenivorans]ABM40113.1 parB-like partition proteins [Polaromonas naphthalenivorans CJ2]
MMTDDTSPFLPFVDRAPRPVVTLKPRARLAEATLASLRAAGSAAPGEALRLPLADIDEDPDQPRTVFDDEELQSMARSILAHGVVQPIVVRPPVNGRYVLAFGARRLRASRLAGVTDIPAVIRAQGPGDFAAQLIENQQRADLSNSDLAAAIARLVREGLTTRQIAAICALKDYQVTAFRQAGDLPPALSARLDTADMRALYDLFRQWSKTPAEVIAALPEAGTFLSVTEARRIIGAITGKPTGSIVLERARAQAAFQDSGQNLPGGEPEDEPEKAPPVREPPAKERPPIEEPPAPEGLPAQAQPKAAPGTVQASQGGAPVFLVAAGNGPSGRLVVDRRAGRAGWALVAYATGIEEVDAAQLRIVRIE